MRIFIALLGLLVGLVGLGIDAWLIFPSVMAVSPTNPVARSFPDALIYFWTFFTHLTNLGLLLVYAAAITRWRWLGWFRQAGTRALMGGYIVLVMLYYHFMLAPELKMEGALAFATVLLHYVAPLFYLGWWALLTPHGTLRYRQIPGLLVPGLAYVAWVLLRGALTGDYPYAILNASKSGYLQVAIGTGILLSAVAVFCVVLVFADTLLGRGKTRVRQ